MGSCTTCSLSPDPCCDRIFAAGYHQLFTASRSELDLLENLKIQTYVIETAWRAGLRRLLFLGSSCIDPKFAEQTIQEEALRCQHGFDAISL